MFFLLAEVFDKFTNDSLKNYGLCRSYYLSAPSLKWNGILKMIKVVFELISDPNM